MDFELLVVKGRSASQALKLADGITSVGRHDDCTLRIKSSQVSRKHCELFEKKGLLLVKDLGSANGTYVNGKKVQGQQVLEPGDDLVIGGITLRVAKVGQSPPAKALPAKKPSDTAVAEVVSVPSGDDDEFEIDFDDEPAAGADVTDDAIELDVDDETVIAPPPAAAASAPKPPEKREKGEEKEKSKAPESQAEPGMADEAIADFLLDIKIDEDE